MLDAPVFLVREEQVLPALAAVHRAEDAARLLRAVCVAQRPHIYDVRIVGMDHDARRARRPSLAEPHVAPRPAPRRWTCRRPVPSETLERMWGLTRPGPHDRRVRRRHRERSHRVTLAKNLGGGIDGTIGPSSIALASEPEQGPARLSNLLAGNPASHYSHRLVEMPPGSSKKRAQGQRFRGVGGHEGRGRGLLRMDATAEVPPRRRRFSGDHRLVRKTRTGAPHMKILNPGAGTGWWPPA